MMGIKAYIHNSGIGSLTIVAMIDSREARVCRDLKCAKNYLPVKTGGTLPNPWDELNVGGRIVKGARFGYLDAERVENLGSIKK